MDEADTVHKSKPRRIARGVRMDAETWQFIDGLAESITNGNTSALLEKWAREKMDAVKAVA